MKARVPWVTPLAAVTAVAVYLAPAVAPTLIYDRARILEGEAWRLWTGHWVHLGAWHLFWNLAVLVPAGVWAECLLPGRTRLLMALSPGFIGAVLLAFEPALALYGGLSGLATGVLAFLALSQLAAGTGERWFWWGVLGLLTVKIGAESLVGHPLVARFADPAVRPVPLAHLAGVAAAGAFRLGPPRYGASM